MAFLPVLFFLLICISIFHSSSSGLRDSLLKSALITFLAGWLSIEFLSLFNLVAYQGVLITWISLDLLAAGWLMWKIRRRSSSPAAKWQAIWKSWFTNLAGISILCLLLIGLISLITLYIAWKAPPNNFDSMTYHMARIPHWIQNHNIRYYPTSIPRQNYSLPVAEYSILHLQLLSKSDHFANLIQWFSFLMSILGSSLIARQLKFTQRGQWLTGALAATLPMAILQSTSTQNDLVVSLFCLGFVYFLMRTIREVSWKNSAFTAISLGLALGTKGTAYIYCAGLGIGVGGLGLLGKHWQEIKRLGLHYSLIIALALALNTGIYLRNFRLYGHPLITSNERVLVDKLSGGILAANLLRNSVMNLASPVSSVNQALERGTEWVLGKQTNNPASTFQNTDFELSFSINEDDAGNGLHLILISIAILILPWLKKDNPKVINQYLITLLFTFLLYSLVFKWQPWGGRLQTPLFLLGTVIGAGLLDQAFSKSTLPAITLALFLLTSTPYLMLNSIRPLLPLWKDGSLVNDPSGERRFLRVLKKYPAVDNQLDSLLSIFYEGRSVIFTERRELYFLGNYDLYDPYNVIAHYLRNTPARQIGLIMDSNDWEYPIWVLVNQNASPGPLIFNHLDVSDPSRRFQSEDLTAPGLILVTRDDYQNGKILSGYQEVLSIDGFQILEPQE